ncbi:hypothetical protein H2200_003032 [Cladophialophora chaetospira]|uniref:endo-1,3(4)-beta-glucanase n=1 Tax=Cladophialophora chaetospira TaxID=386627 RepID=A0AA38XGT1_9EURO|nr:hypothetical protein H2200_003032 [Cladophialophora chaetospira]
MRFPTLVPALLLGGALAQYQQVGNYSGPSFFDHFKFFSEPDPTSGFVKYVDEDIANSTGLAGFVATEEYGNLAYLGADYSSVAQDGRNSTRIESLESFNSSTLWITDIRHHPGNTCGAWSAFWLVGPNWPTGGEIDLLENINLATTNKYVLHNGGNLVVSNFSDPAVANSANMTLRGHFSNLNCSAAAEGNVGCVVDGQNGTFGKNFNDNGGGIIALEYVPQAIKVWQFNRTEIPGDIFNGTPAPLSWRTPDAHFMSDDDQDLDQYFNSLRMVFNTDICGSWIDPAWNTSECAHLAPTCNQYAAQNPDAFKDAYWLIGGVQVYRSAALGMNSTMLPPYSALNTTAGMKPREHIRRTRPRF